MVVFKLIVKHQTVVSATEAVFQNDVNALSKMIKKLFGLFLFKLKSLSSSDRTILFQFHHQVVQTFLRNVWRDFRLPISALATVR